MPTILVTGASGFTGNHFVKLALRKGYSIVALSQTGSKVDGIKVIKCDLTDRVQVDSALETIHFDYVIHLAAISFVGHEDVQAIYQGNVLATINLIDSLLSRPSLPKKVIVASSGNVYGNTKSLPITEEHGYNPENDYAVSKCAMELALLARRSQLPIVTARPFNYTGVGQRDCFIVPKLVNAYKQKLTTLEVGDLNVSRDFSDVRDVVNAYLKLMESDIEHGVYNICSGKAVSLNDVVKMLNELTGHEVEFEINPQFVRKNDINTLYGTNDKLNSTIGSFQKYTLKETLAWMVREQ